MVVMFFPASSIRTRVTLEKGINLLGGRTVLFPTEALDKKENIKDVIGYLNTSLRVRTLWDMSSNNTCWRYSRQSVYIV